MIVLNQPYTLEEFKKVITSKTKKFDGIETVINQYYYMCSKISGLNPIIPILDIIGHDGEVLKKNPGKLFDQALGSKYTQKYREFDTWAEGVKAHIDVITYYMMLGDKDFEKTMYSETKNSNIGKYDDFVARVMKGGEVLGIEVSKNDMYTSIAIMNLNKAGIISDTDSWKKALLTKDGEIKKSSVCSLIRKINNKLL